MATKHPLRAGERLVWLSRCERGRQGCRRNWPKALLQAHSGCYLAHMPGLRAFYHLLAVLLACISIAVRAGPVCATVEIPAAATTMSVVGPGNCHSKMGGHDPVERGKHGKYRVACGAACAALPPMLSDEAGDWPTPLLPQVPEQLLLDGLELAPTPPPPRT